MRMVRVPFELRQADRVLEVAGQTSPTLGVGGNLLCEIAQYVLFYVV